MEHWDAVETAENLGKAKHGEGNSAGIENCRPAGKSGSTDGSIPSRFIGFRQSVFWFLHTNKRRKIMAGSFAKATREKLKLRAAIDGPSGSGKSVTALRFAMTLSPRKRIAVIDTEHGSARKYVGEDFGEGTIEFEGVELKSYSPSNYTSLINEASRGEYDVIVVDSLSHAWEGKDGALELVNKKGGNSFTAWKDVTPMHQAMIQAILDANAHVIVTMRSKTEYVLELDSNGKQVPRKVGMAPVQRAGMEYEFDVYLSMDHSHIGTVTKSRCRAVDGLIVAKPGAEFLRPVIEWLETGETAAPVQAVAKIEQAQLEELAGLLNTLGLKQAAIEKSLPQRFGVRKIGELNSQQAASVIQLLKVDVENKMKRDAVAAEQAAAVASTPADLTPPTANSAPSVASNGHVTSQQINELLWLKQGVPVGEEDWSKALAKRSVDDVRKLTGEQADEMLGKLRAKVAADPALVAKFESLKRTRKPATEEPASSATAAGTDASVPFEMSTAAPAEADPSNAAVAGKATKEQVESMIDYREKLGITLPQWSAILAKKGVTFEGELSTNDADVFLANLDKKYQQKQASAGMAEWGNKVAPDQPATNTGNAANTMSAVATKN